MIPTGAPGTSDGARSGYDAVRIPLRLAESCAAADRRLAARSWASQRKDPGRAIRSLDGAPSSEGEHPTYYGAAVTALARVMLTTRRLGGC